MNETKIKTCDNALEATSFKYIDRRPQFNFKTFVYYPDVY